jgi:ADP-heptose:LPS heptosyltransferase
VPQRILVVKLADLGDLLTATPALRALRRSFPDAEIDALITPGSASLLETSDLVDQLIPFDKFAFDRPTQAARALPAALALGQQLRQRRYDLVLLLHHLTTAFGTAKYAALALTSGAPIRAGLDNGRGRFLTHRAEDHGFGERHEGDYWLAVAATIGATNPRPRLEIPISSGERAAAQRHWVDLGLESSPTALLHPGSGAFSLARRWPAERYVALGNRLASELGLRLAVLAGSATGESELARKVLAGLDRPAALIEGVPSPRTLAALLQQATIFVGNDSGVMHLAAAVEIPIVAIFGPTNHRAWGPYPADSARHAVVREPLACSPCIHRGHSFGRPAGCPARTCLDLVEVEQVLQAAGRVLGQPEPLTAAG